ncbi:sensor histidine kinase [Microbacterium halotolerans]|uniref:sensor histidine kinase n=1 Tax=Microbacterium halotolerans TaxID=246613 RepID=UPI0023E08F45|nr:HAMP domain-containing sensor histidine kinase [Microbacterium halotolerans]
MRLTLSYAGVVVLTGGLLLAVVSLFLLRYVPDVSIPSTFFVPNRNDLLRAFVPRAAAAMIALIVCGLAGGWLLAGRMLAPLNRIGEAARLAAQGSLSYRVALEGRSDEFRDLADVFDVMLAQLEAHVAEQQRFAANASHELRTPLAISQTLLEVARADPERDVDDLIERLQHVNSRAIELTEALLLLTRADGRTFERNPVDLLLLAEEAAENLLPLAESHSVALRVTGEAVPTIGSPTLLQQMIANLVHNGIVHNLRHGGTVSVHLSRQADALVLIVSNTGEAIAPEVLETIVEPFQRASTRTHSGDHAGVGLGLAIVQSIARAHDATLLLTSRHGGGLVAEVRFRLDER